MATALNNPIQEHESKLSSISSNNCNFCQDTILVGQKCLMLKLCSHVLCMNCLAYCVSTQIHLQKIPCPMEACGALIADQDFQTILKDESYQRCREDRKYKRTKKKFSSYMKCKNDNCGGKFELLNISSRLKSVQCPDCGTTNSVSIKIEDSESEGSGKSEIEAISDSEVDTAGRESPTSDESFDEDDVIFIQIQVKERSPESEHCTMNVTGTNSVEETSPDSIMEEAKCQFCGSALTKMEDGLMLQTCSHVFCRDCLGFSIQNHSNAQIPCPLENCGGYMVEMEVKELVEPDVYQMYLQRSVALARQGMDNVFQCQSVNCEGWCEFETGRKTFLCPVCNKNNCLECKTIHWGLSCETYQKLAQAGQLAVAAELMEKESRSGWSQLAGMIQNRGNGVELTDEEFYKNSMPFECPICMSEVEPGEGVILQECVHTICRDCLIGLVEHCDDPVVKCPYIDGNYSCTGYLLPREIKALAPPAIYDKHVERSIKLGESSTENSFHCTTPDCPGWCINDEGAGQFECPRCFKTNCIKCNVIHAPLSCEDYKNKLVQNDNDKKTEAALEELIKSGEFMRCPKCKIPVQKTIGCDWISCTACKTEICWATRGPRWGPRGHGDTSGGCRCKVKGKLCHPACGNCH